MTRKPITWKTIDLDPGPCMICEQAPAVEILESGNDNVRIRLLVCKKCADIIELIT